jgi:hypothetical protein
MRALSSTVDRDGKNIYRSGDQYVKAGRQHRKDINAELRLVELKKESL